MGVGTVDRALEVVACRRQLVELRHGGAVDDLHAAVVGIGILVGQQGVARNPVDVTALRAARDPFVETLIAGHARARVELAVAELAPAAGRIILVVLAMDQRDDLASAAGDIGRRRRELPLVLIIDLQRLAEHRHILGRGLPSEVRVFEQFVIPFQSGQVVTVGIAVALREHPLGICRIDIAVGGAGAEVVGAKIAVTTKFS